MKWNETVASRCRYGDVAERIFGRSEVIWENSQHDYQGSANILARMPDGTFANYTWTYGSCSGCDEWEERGLTDDQIEAEMRRATLFLPDAAALRKFLHLEGEYKDARLPTANDATNGSIPGMMKFLGGGYSEDFKAMGKAAEEWLAQNQPN